ncbi:MAG: MGMT family protein [Planktothrix sp.]
MSLYDKIYEIVYQVPFGKVATYGQIAELANLSNKARLVGYALYKIPLETTDIPWHRVINAKGEISHSIWRKGTDYLQRSRLESEGIKFNSQGKINLSEYLWKPPV